MSGMRTSDVQVSADDQNAVQQLKHIKIERMNNKQHLYNPPHNGSFKDLFPYDIKQFNIQDFI